MRAVQKLFTIEHFVDAVMIVFALASVGNISEYMVAHGHNPVTAYGVAGALGFGLVAASILLARLSPVDGRSFWFMLSATIAFGLLSGTVQSFAYLEHRPKDIFAAYLQGYGYPLIGEGLLALAMSIYTEAQKKKQLVASDAAMDERINLFVNQSMDGVDLSKMTAYIEKQVGVIVRNKIDNIVQQRIVKTAPTIDSVGGMDTIKSPVNFTLVEETDILQPAENSTVNKADARREALLNLLEELDGLEIESLNKSELARKLDVSRPTLLSDISALQSAGKLTLNGHVQVSR